MQTYASLSPMDPFPSIRNRDLVAVSSIDGGGVRGIIPAMVVAEIESRTKKAYSEIFPVLAGASIGAFLSAGIACPDSNNKPKYTAEFMCSEFENNIGKVFYKSWGHRVVSLGGLRTVQYDSTGIETMFKDYLGETPLSSSLSALHIPATLLCKHQAYFFSTATDGNLLLRDVVRAATAAPTYFSPKSLSIGGENGEETRVFGDGGIFDNNPALSCYMDLKNRIKPKTQVVVLSIGTGNSGPTIPYNSMRQAGDLFWAPKILDLTFDATSNAYHRIMESHFCGPKTPEGLYTTTNVPNQPTHYYARIQTQLPAANGSLDNVSPQNIQALKMYATDMIKKHDIQIDTICKLITTPRAV